MKLTGLKSRETHLRLNLRKVRKPAGFPGGSVLTKLPASAGATGDASSIPGLGRSPRRRKWQPTPVFLPGESPGQRSLVRYSPWGRKELDATEHKHTHTHTYKQASRDQSALIYMPCKSTVCQAFYQTLYIIVLFICLSSGLWASES